MFGYNDLDNDGTYKFLINKSTTLTGDNLPENLSSVFSILLNEPTDIYINISELGNNLIISNAFSEPIFICKKF